jgi:hypothetical protein
MATGAFSTGRDLHRSFCGAILSIARTGKRSGVYGKVRCRSRRSWPGDGASAFPCEPSAFAAAEPALWQAALVPTTVILDTAPPGIADAAPFDIDAWPIILADRMLSTGRHLILGDIDGPHRLWVRDPLKGSALAYVLVRDDAIDLRHSAVQRFHRRLAGAAPVRLPPGFAPTPFQRWRLSMLLDILDAVLDRERSTITTHEIARRHVYPHMRIGRGNEWKSSSERRRTQRLIDEAMGLMNGGYRALLRG